MYTIGELKCSIPGPMQGLSLHLHRVDGEKVWGEEKEHKSDVKTLDEKKYTRKITNGSAPLGHYGPCSEGEPHNRLGGCEVPY